MTLDELRVWKNDLLELLNVGWLNHEHWQKFITEAKTAGCDAMAEDMQRRFDYYAQEVQHG